MLRLQRPQTLTGGPEDCLLEPSPAAAPIGCRHSWHFTGWPFVAAEADDGFRKRRFSGACWRNLVVAVGWTIRAVGGGDGVGVDDVALFGDGESLLFEPPVVWRRRGKLSSEGSKSTRAFLTRPPPMRIGTDGCMRSEMLTLAVAFACRPALPMLRRSFLEVGPLSAFVSNDGDRLSVLRRLAAVGNAFVLVDAEPDIFLQKDDNVTIRNPFYLRSILYPK